MSSNCILEYIKKIKTAKTNKGMLQENDLSVIEGQQNPLLKFRFNLSRHFLRAANSRILISSVQFLYRQLFSVFRVFVHAHSAFSFLGNFRVNFSVF